VAGPTAFPHRHSPAIAGISAARACQFSVRRRNPPFRQHIIRDATGHTLASRSCRSAATLDTDDDARGVLGERGARTEAPRRSACPPRSMCLTMDRPKDEPSAREVLRDWAKAPGYSNRAAEFLELARCAPLPAVRKRYLRIAEHYRKLAEAEKSAQIKKSRTQFGA
jgi:hypothetical protein